MSKRKPKPNKCIYFTHCGNMAKRRSKEHAFPKQLMPPNSEGVTINGIVCTECNNKLGRSRDEARDEMSLDEILIKKSYVGVSHNDFEVSFGRGDSSIYLQARNEQPPLREFAVYNHAIVIVKPGDFVENPNVLAYRLASPMPCQLILTQLSNTSSYEDVLAMASLHPAYNDVCEDDAYRLHPNYLVFGPRAAKRYYRNPGKFVSKFLKTTSDSEYFQLRLIPPNREDSELRYNEKCFKKFITETSNTQIGWHYEHPDETIQSISGELVGVPDYRRSIAKIAFHCFLYFCEEKRKEKKETEKIPTGNEPIFDEIKAYIHKGDYSGRIPVIETPPYKDYMSPGNRRIVRNAGKTERMVEHCFAFFINETNAVCVVEFYVGTKVNSIFTIDLAGRDEDFEIIQGGVLTIPYCVVSPNHPLLNQIIPATDEEIAMAENGEFQRLRQPTKILYPTPQNVAKATCGLYERIVK